jgi:hypothetical protein
MDEALRRFEFLSKPRGLIVSLDADTLVAKNYLTEIESAFILNQSESGFTLQFKHDFNKEIYSTEVINACKLYETYLRYFRLSIEITGYPNSFHTIGSCFAVDAISYAKVGGMSRRQGGEDFYFLHKLAQMGEIGQINKPLVFPSPRISDRVPFGTGPAVRNIIADKNYMVYNFYLFFILKEFFDCFENFWNFESLHTIEIPEEILLFVGKDKLFETIMECKNNCNQISSFKKRLFSKFDAFFIVKFLNSFNKSQKYPPLPVTEAVTLLLEKSGITTNSHSIDEVYDKIFDLDVECVSSA